MKIEARCAVCSKRYLLDEVFLGTVLPCPACGASDGLRVEAPTRAARPRAPASASSSPPTRRRAVPVRPTPPPAPIEAAASVVAPPTAAAPPAEVAEVVCPRCKLHFSPRPDTRPGSDDMRKTVLVVEDMALFRDIASTALSSRFEVKTAADLTAAREHLARGAVDLIVLDPKLDGESGVDLLRDLPTRHCPVVIYTDQDESETYGESWQVLRRLGADDLVAKGLHSGEALARKVCELLGEEPAEDE